MDYNRGPGLCKHRGNCRPGPRGGPCHKGNLFGHRRLFHSLKLFESRHSAFAFHNHLPVLIHTRDLNRQRAGADRFMRHTEFEVNSIPDEDWSGPTVILPAPECAGARAVHPHERGYITCKQHSMDNAALKARPKGKTFIHVKWIAVAAKSRKVVHITRGDRLIELRLVAGLDLLEIGELDQRGRGLDP